MKDYFREHKEVILTLGFLLVLLIYGIYNYCYKKKVGIYTVAHISKFVSRGGDLDYDTYMEIYFHGKHEIVLGFTACHGCKDSFVYVLIDSNNIADPIIYDDIPVKEIYKKQALDRSFSGWKRIPDSTFYE